MTTIDDPPANLPGPRDGPDDERESASNGHGTTSDPLRLREIIAYEASATADQEAASAQRDAARSQLKSTRIQVWSTALALIVALVAATQGTIGLIIASSATASQADSVERQNRETRLATAMEALGSDDPAARIGGFTLLQRNIEERLAVAETPENTVADREDAAVLYNSALDLVENYLKSPDKTGGDPTTVGQGVPRVPAEVSYVVGRLGSLVRLGPRVTAIRRGTHSPRPNIDLANAMLYKTTWNNVDFSDLPESSKFFPRIDLRGASLGGSGWAGVTLTGAFLQCAVVPRAGADTARPVFVSFRNADLTHADLRGADLSGADFTDANLESADLRGANIAGTILTNAGVVNARFDDTFGTPTGVPVGRPAHAPRDGPFSLGDGRPGNFGDVSRANCLASPIGTSSPSATPELPAAWPRPRPV
ncbi:pentapeptide repeat-containing protein [Actinomycetospora sp. C-140]